MPSQHTFILGLAAVSLATPAFGQGRFRPLFDGKNLDGWTQFGDANRTVRDGAICITATTAYEVNIFDTRA
ncbi:hypothetical protein IAG41_05050 [Sphingomonas sp. JC676]|uniref:hypothetical protein n=1 Tax=Sphingomonas sp. JC676 TaxID=2768065 RepID=UPI0016579940|nr:hypothetical protein [Sphingomonas sp. JC676]MBC9031752.1 hypothetical protein [Sphingomonas sp. JC676]